MCNTVWTIKVCRVDQQRRVIMGSNLQLIPENRNDFSISQTEVCEVRIVVRAENAANAYYPKAL